MTNIDKILLDLEELLELVNKSYDDGEIDANDYDLQVNDIEELNELLNDKSYLTDIDINLLNIDIEQFNDTINRLDKCGDLECLRQFVKILI